MITLSDKNVTPVSSKIREETWNEHMQKVSNASSNQVYWEVWFGVWDIPRYDFHAMICSNTEILFGLI